METNLKEKISILVIIIMVFNLSFNILPRVLILLIIGAAFSYSGFPRRIGKWIKEHA